MDQAYSMDTVDPKQPPGPQIRRGFYGEEPEFYRQNPSLEMKYPFPQPHLFPPNSSVRVGPFKAPGQYPQDGQHVHEVQPHDPRYVPQDFVSSVREMDDKRYKNFYGYSGTPASGMTHFNSGLNPPHGMTPFLGGAGATPLSGLSLPPSSAPSHGKAPGAGGLVTPIPPLHVQQEKSRNDEAELTENSENTISSKCSRCKKDFVQRLSAPADSGKGKSGEPKIFKLCFHCRDLQRQRSRRWQMKTKDKQGACRRCGSEIPIDQQRFVLCPQCRKSLRVRKANRAAQGRCVHCSGPISSSIAKEEGADGESPEESESRRSSEGGSFKVCQRCRENDKIRRTNLERMGNCNRCAKALVPDEQGRHKVCFACRQKKKKSGPAPFFGSEETQSSAAPQMGLPQNTPLLPAGQPLQPPHQMQSTQPFHPHHGAPPAAHNMGPHMHEMAQNVMVPSMGYAPIDQSHMLAHPGMGNFNGAPLGVPQDMPLGYGQQMQPMTSSSAEMYNKPPMTQLPSMQPHMDQGYQQYIGYPPGNRNGHHFTNNRI